MPRHKHKKHHEMHRSMRTGWLRAAVLGSNDAIVSTASLILGVGAADASRSGTLVAGGAALIAGAMSMAVGEFVSVSSQRDAEQADIAIEKEELAEEPHAELAELTAIYEKRGLDHALAKQVAEQLTKHDGLAAHLRDELGIEPHDLAQPLQAAWISAASFALFALVPILALAIAPRGAIGGLVTVGVASLVALAALGALGAKLGGASLGRAAARVTIGGLLAMAATAAVGHLLGVAIS